MYLAYLFSRLEIRILVSKFTIMNKNIKCIQFKEITQHSTVVFL